MHQPRRREVLAGVGGVGCLLASAAVGPDSFFGSTLDLQTTVEPGRWPLAGRDPRRSGYAPDADPPTTEPTEQWAETVTWFGREDETAGPVVDGERVFLQTTDAVVALDATNGERLWHLSLPAVEYPAEIAERYRQLEDEPLGPVEGPFEPDGWLALADGQLFVTGRHEDMTVLYAVDVTAGTVNWAYPGLSYPRLVGGTVFCYGPGGVISTAAVLDARSGRIRERLDYEAFMPEGQGATFVGDDLTAPSQEAIALHIETGDTDVVFAQRDRAGTHSPTITTDGVLLTGAYSTLSAVDLVAGTERWTVETPGDGAREYVTDDESVYTVGGQTVAAYAADSGRTRWTQSIPEAIERPALTDDALYVPTRTGLSVLDAESGTLLNEVGGPGPKADWRRPPVVAGNRLYWQAGDGTLRAYA